MDQRHARKLWGIVLAEGQDCLVQPWNDTGINRFSQMSDQPTLLEATLEQVEQLIPRERILIVVSQPHHDEVASQLTHWPQDNSIVQPTDYGTAPSILLALAHLARREPFATVAIFPEGAGLFDEDNFVPTVQQAVEETQCFPRKLTLLGMTPDHEADGYVAEAATVWEMVRQAVPELYQDFMYIRRALGKAQAEWVIESVYGMLTSTTFFTEVCTRLESRLRVLHGPGDSREALEKKQHVVASLQHLGTSNKMFPSLQHTREESGAALL